MSRRVGKLSQTLGFGINRQNGKVEFEVEFGTQRPGGSQDRHISAYVLILEIFKSRLNGLEVESAIDIIPEIVNEYILDDSPGMKQFLSYAKQQQDLLAMQGVLTKEERSRVYEIECERLKYLQTYTRSLEERLEIEKAKSTDNTSLIRSLEWDLKEHQDIIAKELEKDTIISAMDARNKYKEADLWKYQECLVNTLKAAVVTMNKMEITSFKGKESAYDMGNQGQAIKESISRLRSEDSWERKPLDSKQNSTDITKLLDYPRDEIEALPKDDIDMTTPEVVSKIFNRHIKYIYDSFEGFRNLSQNDSKALMQQSFANFRKGQGWSKGKGKYLYPNSHQNVDSGKGKYILPEKFNALRSRSLTFAIKELEEQVRSGIEEQIEEEQKQSVDSQDKKKESIKNSSGGVRV